MYSSITRGQIICCRMLMIDFITANGNLQQRQFKVRELIKEKASCYVVKLNYTPVAKFVVIRKIQSFVKYRLNTRTQM